MKTQPMLNALLAAALAAPAGAQVFQADLSALRKAARGQAGALQASPVSAQVSCRAKSLLHEGGEYALELRAEGGKKTVSLRTPTGEQLEFPVIAESAMEFKRLPEFLACDSKEEDCIEKFFPGLDKYGIGLPGILGLMESYKKEGIPAEFSFEPSQAASGRMFHIQEPTMMGTIGLAEYYDAQGRLLGRIFQAIEVAECRSSGAALHPAGTPAARVVDVREGCRAKPGRIYMGGTPCFDERTGTRLQGRKVTLRVSGDARTVEVERSPLDLQKALVTVRSGERVQALELPYSALEAAGLSLERMKAGDLLEGPALEFVQGVLERLA